MNKEYTHEIQDTYCQLDKDIEQLLDAIDKKGGAFQDISRIHR